MFDLRGKTAIITAAGQGMGRAIALALAQPGADVVVSDINVETCRSVADEIRASGGRAIDAPADARVKQDVENLVRKTVDEFGKVDVLVNVVGGELRRPALEMTEVEWDADIRRNLTYTFLGGLFSLR